jgi:hypothetical protein
MPNHSNAEAGEHNHEAPRNICAGISNQEDLKYKNIKVPDAFAEAVGLKTLHHAIQKY